MTKRNMFKTIAFSLFLGLFVANGYAEDGHEGHDHEKHEEHGEHGDVKAKHHGTILEVGEHKAHIEFVHDHKAGVVSLYIYDAKGETRELKDAPRLNLKLTSGKKQLKTELKHKGQYVAKDTVLKSEISGKISLKLDGTRYLVTIKEHHHDDHDDHEGHGH